MAGYVAFLRGINVGGNNRVPMPELKKLFEENCFTKVITYINSGNVIFNSDKNSVEEIKKDCELMLVEHFRFNIPVIVVSIGELSTVVANAPLWWGRDPDSKHNAIFVIPPVTVEEVFREVGETKPEYEKVGHYGRVIFWSASIKTFSRTRWSKVVGSSVYGSITIRNTNTVKKILQLYGKVTSDKMA